MEKNIFYLEGSEKTFPNGVSRIAFGDLIKVDEQNMELSLEYSNPEHLTGSVGFADITTETWNIPTGKTKKGNPCKYDLRDTCVIISVEVEKKYRRKGFGRKLIKQGEKLAWERGLGTTVAYQTNTNSYRMLREIGYEPLESNSRNLFRQFRQNNFKLSLSSSFFGSGKTI